MLNYKPFALFFLGCGMGARFGSYQYFEIAAFIMLTIVLLWATIIKDWKR